MPLKDTITRRGRYSRETGVRSAAWKQLARPHEVSIDDFPPVEAGGPLLREPPPTHGGVTVAVVEASRQRGDASRRMEYTIPTCD